MQIYVSTKGRESSDGAGAPVNTLEQAFEIIKGKQDYAPGESVTIHMNSGICYLGQPLVINLSEISVPVQIEGSGNTVLAGGYQLETDWKVQEDGIWKTKIRGRMPFDQLFVNGEKRILARYPKYNPKERYLNGYAEDCLDSERIKKYQNPAGGLIHGMHEAMWGDMHFRILGKTEDGILRYEGGWQNNRPSALHKTYRYIENIREELTAPGEWYADEEYLYYIPLPGETVAECRFEVSCLKNLVTVKGKRPHEKGSRLCIRGITFRYAKHTFMEEMEPVLRSDWCIYRGGAVLAEDTDGVVFEDCCFEALGTNALTISGNCSAIEVKGCEFRNIGASEVLIAGKTSAVRSPLYGYGAQEAIEDMDCEAGPLTEDYPRECLIEDCLIMRSGEMEKQSAGICLTMCSRIRMRHNTICHVPRAGINICDGTWGGHVMEKNLVFDTVRETGDHGAFNSWGRDRYWDCRYPVMEENLRKDAELPLADAMEPIRMVNNVFSCDYGWDIDLDDGSSNYIIEGNVCLKGGIKNREGIMRVVCNNFMLQNTFHPHVWFRDSRDRFERNVIFRSYEDINLNGWGSSFDHNLLVSENTDIEVLRKKSGMDQNSETVQLTFSLTDQNHFCIEEEDILLRHGILQPDIDDCGVRKQELRAKTVFPHVLIREALSFCMTDQEPEKSSAQDTYADHEITLKQLSGPEEMSAYGMYAQEGIIVLDTAQESIWQKMGIHSGDIILRVNDQRTENMEQTYRLLCACRNAQWTVSIWREQKEMCLKGEGKKGTLIAFCS